MKAYLAPETYAIIKSNRPDSAAFVCITDLDQITLIIDQTKYSAFEVLEKSLDWKMFSLETPTEIGAVALTAKITTALTVANIKTMSINAYARDHFLIPTTETDRAIAVLQTLNITVTTK